MVRKKVTKKLPTASKAKSKAKADSKAGVTSVYPTASVAGINQPSVGEPKTLGQELDALWDRINAAFMPELKAIEAKFGYRGFYGGMALFQLRRAARSMAAAVACNDPRCASGKPIWWDNASDRQIADGLYNRLSQEVSAMRQLARVRKPEAFDASNHGHLVFRVDELPPHATTA